MVKQAMIFAAGLGTRLRPLTDRMPKALVPVAGKPLLAHALERMHLAGFERIIVNVHHFADQVEAFLQTVSYPGMEIRVSDERDLLRDTGGAIRRALPLLDMESPLLIHNVDIFSNLDLTDFYEKGCEEMARGAWAYLLVSERESSRYFLFDDQSCLRAWKNVKTGEMKSFETSLPPTSPYAFAGIHMVAPALLQTLETEPEKFSVVDLYLRLAARHPVKGCLKKGLQLLDVGKVSNLRQAEAMLLFKSGHTCSQSVLLACAPQYGLSRETALALASSFSGGVARSGELCGAVSGMLMILGMKYPIVPGQPETKRLNFEKVQAALASFRSEMGAVRCDELLRIRKGGCSDCVACAVRLAETLS